MAEAARVALRAVKDDLEAGTGVGRVRGCRFGVVDRRACEDAPRAIRAQTL